MNVETDLNRIAKRNTALRDTFTGVPKKKSFGQGAVETARKILQRRTKGGKGVSQKWVWRWQ